MTHHLVTRLRPGYSDTAALNDLHALLTTATGQTPAEELLADIGLILARAGRPLIPVRDIEITITDTPHGQPVAVTVSAGTTVTVRQESYGSGLHVAIAAG